MKAKKAYMSFGIACFRIKGSFFTLHFPCPHILHQSRTREPASRQDQEQNRGTTFGISGFCGRIPEKAAFDTNTPRSLKRGVLFIACFLIRSHRFFRVTLPCGQMLKERAVLIESGALDRQLQEGPRPGDRCYKSVSDDGNHKADKSVG